MASTSRFAPVLALIFSIAFASCSIGPSIDKKSIENEVLSEKFRKTSLWDVFGTMKSLDPAAFTGIVDRLYETAKKSDYKSVEQVTATANELIKSSLNKYYADASGDVIIAYLNAYLAILEDLAAAHPDVVCKLEDPMTFGDVSPTDLALISAPKVKEFREVFPLMVKSAVAAAAPQDTSGADALFNSFLSTFISENPEVAEIMVKDEGKVPGADYVRKTANAYIVIYKRILALEPGEAVKLLKYMRTIS